MTQRELNNLQVVKQGIMPGVQLTTSERADAAFDDRASSDDPTKLCIDTGEFEIPCKYSYGFMVSPLKGGLGIHPSAVTYSFYLSDDYYLRLNEMWINQPINDPKDNAKFRQYFYQLKAQLEQHHKISDLYEDNNLRVSFTNEDEMDFLSIEFKPAFDEEVAGHFKVNLR